MSVFAGLPKGGCWYLNVADHEPADTGTICRWTVHVLNDNIVAARPATWGELKLRYR
jgi:subtilisin-like proprotein convertase family protein